jgi:hypothetical protein
MCPEADLLFSTARIGMSGEDADRVRAIARQQVDWIQLIRLAMRHETTALLYWHLQRICPDLVPLGVLRPLAAHFEMQAAEARRRAQELVRILRALEERGIFAVAYKGPMLAQRLYGDLSLRDFSEQSDLDVMIRPRDLPRAQESLLNEGYGLAFLERVTEADEYVRANRELHFRSETGDRRMLELHWHFMLRSARVREDPERFLRRVEMISLAGAEVRSLPLETYALVLAMHATKHKWGKLKLICDVMEILRSPGVDWGYVLREARHLGISRMLAVGVLMAENPLRVTAPRELTERLKIDRTALLLAAECRRALLDEPDQTWLEVAEYQFLFRSRERLRDRATMYFKDRFLPRITPDERDRRLIAIPEALSALYYFVRPVRMIWEKITEHP